MNKKLFFLFYILLFSLSFSVPSYGEDNPFLSRSSEKKVEKVIKENNSEPVKNSETWYKFSQIQHKMNNKLARLTRDVKEGKSYSALFILISIAFLYGVFHSIGPGHGKCIVCSYFITEGTDIKKGLLLGNLVAVIHAISAITVTTTIYYIIKGSYASYSDDISRIMSISGYSLITLVGIYLLVKNIYEINKKKKTIVENNHDHSSCGHNHHDHSTCNHSHENHVHEDKHDENCSHTHKEEKSKNIFLIALAIGVLPCPGAITILLFSISIDFIQMGVLLAFFIALGMGLTMSLLGMITILSRKKAVNFLSIKNSSLIEKSENFVKVFGALMVIFFGSIFLSASI
jgi:nickel/cobalt exporter